MEYAVAPGSIGKITLNDTDTDRSVIQNVAVILSTRKHSCPMNRGLGLPMEFVDKPMNVAEAMMAGEIYEALEEFEPRAGVVDIEAEIDENTPGRLIPKVIIEIDPEGDGESYD